MPRPNAERRDLRRQHAQRASRGAIVPATRCAGTACAAGATTGGIATDADARRAHLARMGASIAARMGAARLRDDRAQRRAKARDPRRGRDAVGRQTSCPGDGQHEGRGHEDRADGVLRDRRAPRGRRSSSSRSCSPPRHRCPTTSSSEVVTSELGAPPTSVFAAFDPEPMAAASIGQVHAAETQDGRDVVVKVQYPGVDEAIKADLQNADMLFQTVAAMFGGFNPQGAPAGGRRADDRGVRLHARGRQPAVLRRPVPRPSVREDPRGRPRSTRRRACSRPSACHGRRFYDVLENDSQEAKDR